MEISHRFNPLNGFVRPFALSRHTPGCEFP
jgi:hypothetical protein